MPVRAANRPPARLLRKIFWAVAKRRREIDGSGTFPHHLLCRHLLLLYSEPFRLPARYPCFRQIEWQLLFRHLCPQHTPCPRHYPVKVIAPTTEGYPTSFAIGMRQFVRQFHLLLNTT